MKTRPIDANQLYRIEKLLDTDIVKKDKVGSELLEQVLYDIQHVPTLTPPTVGRCKDCPSCGWHWERTPEPIEYRPFGGNGLEELNEIY